MRSRPVGFFACSTAAFFAVLATASFLHAQSNPQQAAPKSAPAAASAPAPAPKRDLTGVWQLQGGDGGAQPIAEDKDMPPMTPWAKVKFDARQAHFQLRARSQRGRRQLMPQQQARHFPFHLIPFRET